VEAGDRESVGITQSVASNDATFRTIMEGDERSLCGRIFMDSCFACHRLSGTAQSFCAFRPLPMPAEAPVTRAVPSRRNYSLHRKSSVLSADPSFLISAALTHLTYVAALAFVARGAGTIINIPFGGRHRLNGVCRGPKAYVIALSH
jgi:hypothetical protein